MSVFKGKLRYSYMDLTSSSFESTYGRSWERCDDINGLIQAIETDFPRSKITQLKGNLNGVFQIFKKSRIRSEVKKVVIPVYQENYPVLQGVNYLLEHLPIKLTHLCKKMNEDFEKQLRLEKEATSTVNVSAKEKLEAKDSEIKRMTAQLEGKELEIQQYIRHAEKQQQTHDVFHCIKTMNEKEDEIRAKSNEIRRLKSRLKKEEEIKQGKADKVLQQSINTEAFEMLKELQEKKRDYELQLEENQRTTTITQLKQVEGQVNKKNEQQKIEVPKLKVEINGKKKDVHNKPNQAQEGYDRYVAELKEKHQKYQVQLDEHNEIITQLQIENQQIKENYEQVIEEKHNIIIQMKETEVVNNNQKEELVSELAALKEGTWSETEELIEVGENNNKSDNLTGPERARNKFLSYELLEKEREITKLKEQFYSEKAKIKQQLQQNQMAIEQLKEVEVQSNSKKEQQMEEINLLQEQLLKQDEEIKRLKVETDSVEVNPAVGNYSSYRYGHKPVKSQHKSTWTHTSSPWEKQESSPAKHEINMVLQQTKTVATEINVRKVPAHGNDITRMKDQVQIKNQELSQLSETLNKKELLLKEISERNVQQRDELAQTKAKLQEKSAVIDEHVVKISSIKKQQLDTLRQLHEENDERIGQVENSLVEVKASLEQQLSKNDEHVEEIKELQCQINDRNREIQTSKKEKSKLDGEVHQLSERITLLDSSLTACKNTLKEQVTKYNEQKGKRKNLTNHMRIKEAELQQIQQTNIVIESQLAVMSERMTLNENSVLEYQATIERQHGKMDDQLTEINTLTELNHARNRSIHQLTEMKKQTEIELQETMERLQVVENTVKGNKCAIEEQMNISEEQVAQIETLAVQIKNKDEKLLQIEKEKNDVEAKLLGVPRMNEQDSHNLEELEHENRENKKNDTNINQVNVTKTDDELKSSTECVKKLTPYLQTGREQNVNVKTPQNEIKEREENDRENISDVNDSFISNQQCEDITKESDVFVEQHEQLRNIIAKVTVLKSPIAASVNLSNREKVGEVLRDDVTQEKEYDNTLVGDKKLQGITSCHMNQQLERKASQCDKSLNRQVSCPNVTEFIVNGTAEQKDLLEQNKQHIAQLTATIESMKKHFETQLDKANETISKLRIELASSNRQIHQMNTMMEMNEKELLKPEARSRLTTIDHSGDKGKDQCTKPESNLTYKDEFKDAGHDSQTINTEAIFQPGPEETIHCTKTMPVHTIEVSHQYDTDGMNCSTDTVGGTGGIDSHIEDISIQLAEEICKLECKEGEYEELYNLYQHQSADIDKLKDEIMFKEEQIQELSLKLASEFNTKISTDESCIENVNTKNRPINVIEEYHMFCANQWLEAKSTIDKKYGNKMPEYSKLGFLCHIMKVVEKEVNSLMVRIRTSLQEQLSQPINFILQKHRKGSNSKDSGKDSQKRRQYIPEAFTNMFGDLLKNTTDKVDFHLLVQQITNVLDGMASNPNLSKNTLIWTTLKHEEPVQIFLTSLTKLVWKMKIQRPQMDFQSSVQYKGEKFQDVFWNSDNVVNPAVIEVYPMIYCGYTLMTKGKVLLLDPQHILEVDKQRVCSSEL